MRRIARPNIPDDEKLVLFPMDVLLASFDKYLTPEVRSRLEAEFSEHLGKPYYPVLVGNRLIDQVCRLCLGEYPIEQARQLLGHSYLQRYRETVLGQLLLDARPLVSVEWFVQGLPRNYASATNFGTYWVEELEPQHWSFNFEDDPGYPDWILGTLLAGAEILQVPGYRVTYTLPAPQHISFDIRWD